MSCRREWVNQSLERLGRIVVAREDVLGPEGVVGVTVVDQTLIFDER